MHSFTCTMLKIEIYFSFFFEKEMMPNWNSLIAFLFFDKKLDIRIYFNAAPCIPGQIPNDLILKRGQKRFNCVDLVKKKNQIPRISSFSTQKNCV